VSAAGEPGPDGDGGPGPEDRDPFEPRLVSHASGLLREFNQAGVLSAADVHVARRLGTLGGESDEATLLAIALAVRAPRLGHVHVDLERIRDTAAVDADEPVDLERLDWPAPAGWVAGVAASPLVTVGEEALLSDEPGDPVKDASGGPRPLPGGPRPLRLTGAWLYLDRYWVEELAVAQALGAMRAQERPEVDSRILDDGLARLFADAPRGRQAQAAAAAVRRRLTVVAGGPGTGKTTTVARIVALLYEQAAAAGAGAPPLIALAAPTGKAAARLQEAVHAEATRIDVAPAIREQLLELSASTLHRLLGWRPDSNSRFRHGRNQRLPHDAVIVDETSMVSLSLMARLIEALRSDARLILVGDPGQLASIEAGAVLGDIVGPAGAGSGPDVGSGPAAGSGSVVGSGPGAGSGPGPGPWGARDGIIVLDRGHRFGGEIAQLAAAIRGGDGDRTVSLLGAGSEAVTWIDADVARQSSPAAVRDPALATARTVIDEARAGASRPALDALGSFRILCAHRRGPYGVSTWTARMEGWLEAELEGFSAQDRWYVGRPLLVFENDYELGLNNGDTGVVVRTADDRVVAAFDRGGETIAYSPNRLGAVDTVYAMTIHKSQGSQFDAAAVLLPDPGSRILTRELLYTAATRARRRLIVVGPEASIRAAVGRPVARASGLGRRLRHESANNPLR
jgi:exodeoxyribonuclease V alpha subunit